MVVYRCYFIDESDRIRSFVEIVALTDSDATSQARMHARSRNKAFELWRGAKFVCREP
jgi:hypothetical protein